MIKIFVVVLTFISLQGYSQHNRLTIRELTSQIQNGIYDNYKPDSIQLSKLCQSSCLFIKFSALNNRTLTDIEFSGDTTALVRSALRKAMLSLRANKLLMESLAALKKPVIQPFVFNYRAGCPIELSPAGPKVDRTQHAVLRMLQFGEDDLLAVDCLLLTPILVSNVVMY